MLQKVSFSESDVDAALERAAVLETGAHFKNGGASLGFMSKGPNGLVRLKVLGNRDAWTCPFDEYTRLKLTAALREGVSTFTMLNSAKRLMPEERRLHAGGLVFGDIAIACSGVGEGNEFLANAVAKELGLL